MRTTPAFRRSTIAIAITTATVCLSAAPSYAGEDGSSVMPAHARPHGYSLADMARASAIFQTSSNSPANYPRTPFQILYAPTFDYTPDGAGLSVTGTNSFDVKARTRFYVPVLQADDSPPPTGAFPTTASQTVSYLFGKSQLGVTNSQIIVDGERVDVGPDYAVGPLDTPPLLDGGGTHEVEIAAFLDRLEPGTHTVEVAADVTGEAFQRATGLAFVHERFSYVVHAQGR